MENKVTGQQQVFEKYLREGLFMYLLEKVMFKFNVVSLEKVLLPILFQFS